MKRGVKLILISILLNFLRTDVLTILEGTTTSLESQWARCHDLDDGIHPSLDMDPWKNQSSLQRK